MNKIKSIFIFVFLLYIGFSPFSTFGYFYYFDDYYPSSNFDQNYNYNWSNWNTNQNNYFTNYNWNYNDYNNWLNYTNSWNQNHTSSYTPQNTTNFQTNNSWSAQDYNQSWTFDYNSYNQQSDYQNPNNYWPNNNWENSWNLNQTTNPWLNQNNFSYSWDWNNTNNFWSNSWNNNQWSGTSWDNNWNNNQNNTNNSFDDYNLLNWYNNQENNYTTSPVNSLSPNSSTDNVWYFPDYNSNNSSINNQNNYLFNNHNNTTSNDTNLNNSTLYSPTLSINKTQFSLTDTWQLTLTGAPPNQPTYICAINNQGIQSCSRTIDLGFSGTTDASGSWQAQGNWIKNGQPDESVLGNWTEWMYVGGTLQDGQVQGGIKSNKIVFTVGVNPSGANLDDHFSSPDVANYQTPDSGLSNNPATSFSNTTPNNQSFASQIDDFNNFNTTAASILRNRIYSMSTDAEASNNSVFKNSTSNTYNNGSYNLNGVVGSIETVDIMEKPTAMALSPDKKTIYIAGWGNELEIVDVESKNKEKIIYPNVLSNSAVYTKSICVDDQWGVIIPLNIFGTSRYGDQVVMSIVNKEPKIFFKDTWGIDQCFIYDNKLYLFSSIDWAIYLWNSPNDSQPQMIRFQIPYIQSFLLVNPQKVYISFFDESKNKEAIAVVSLINGETQNVIYLPGSFSSRIDFVGKQFYISKQFYWWDENIAAYPIVVSFNNNKIMGVVLIDVNKDELINFIDLASAPPGIASLNYPDIKYLKLSYGVAAFSTLKNKHELIYRHPQSDSINYKYSEIKTIPYKDTDIVVALFDKKLVFIEYQTSEPEDVFPVITNAATFFVSDHLAPGQIATIFGDFPIDQSLVASEFPIPTQLGNVKVFVKDYAKKYPAPIFFVSKNQINFQVPWEILKHSSLSVEVQINDFSLYISGLSYAESDVGVFSANIDGSWRPIPIIVRASDGGLVSPTKPARPGEWLTIYLTGLGQVNGSVETGKPAPMEKLLWVDPIPKTLWNGQDAELNFAGLAPGWVGLYQINFKVPDNADSGFNVFKIIRLDSSGQYYNSYQTILVPVAF